MMKRGKERNKRRDGGRNKKLLKDRRKA